MVRRLSPRDFRKLMKRMGINVEELSGVLEVRIKLENRELIVEDPQVLVMKVYGQDVLQIMGKLREVAVEKVKAEEYEVSEEDVKLVSEYTGAPLEVARKALIEAKGDIAKAIMMIQGEQA